MCAFTVWTGVLGATLAVIFLLNASVIFAHIGRRILLPASMQVLNAAHTPVERTAFSNAFLDVFDEVEHQGLMSLDPWVGEAMTNFVTAAQDQNITRAESAHFCSTVWHGVTHGARRKHGDSP